MTKKTLTIYIPLYNEEDGVENLYNKLKLVEKKLENYTEYTIVFGDSTRTLVTDAYFNDGLNSFT